MSVRVALYIIWVSVSLRKSRSKVRVNFETFNEVKLVEIKQIGFIIKFSEV